MFTGAIYHALLDIAQRAEEHILYEDALCETAKYLRGLLLRAIIQAHTEQADYASVARKMISLAEEDDKPVRYYCRVC